MAAIAKPKLAPSRIFRLPDVMELTGLGRGSIYRLAKLGRFPKPVKLSDRASGWRETDLNAWLESRKEAA